MSHRVHTQYYMTYLYVLIENMVNLCMRTINSNRIISVKWEKCKFTEKLFRQNLS